jgi:hypothetical protein
LLRKTSLAIVHLLLLVSCLVFLPGIFIFGFFIFFFTHHIINRNAPSAIDFGVVKLNDDGTAEFTIQWSTDYADLGTFGVI